MPIIAELYRDRGAKLITLQSRLGMSRSMVKQSLERLIDAGLVAQNPGYGHPLRPEYVLTAHGEDVGPFCQQFYQEGQRQDVTEVFKNKWACPAIISTGLDQLRFNELKRKLSPVTSRALSVTLKNLQEGRCLAVSLIDGHPPANLYALTRDAQGLYEIYKDHCGVFEGLCLVRTGE